MPFIPNHLDLFICSIGCLFLSVLKRITCDYKIWNYDMPEIYQQISSPRNMRTWLYAGMFSKCMPTSEVLFIKYNITYISILIIDYIRSRYHVNHKVTGMEVSLVICWNIAQRQYSHIFPCKFHHDLPFVKTELMDSSTADIIFVGELCIESEKRRHICLGVTLISYKWSGMYTLQVYVI